MDKFKKLLEECKEFVADDPIYYGLELSTKDVAIVVEVLEKQVLTERAISAFIGQASENDVYLGFYMVHKYNRQHCQVGDTVSSLEELIDWYRENYPE